MVILGWTNAITEYEFDTTSIIDEEVQYTNIQRSCGVLYFHFFCGLSMVILGWTTFAARWIPILKPYHRQMGKVWFYGMIVLLYSSTYASYNGFRWFIFMFGVICYGGMIIGHSFIRKFQENKAKQNEIAAIPTESPDGDADKQTYDDTVDVKSKSMAHSTRMFGLS